MAAGRKPGKLVRWLPCVEWGARYNRATAIDDAIAALIVTIMLIPQSLAYALIAGLPAQVGLYASIAPLVLYGVFGTSRVLAVGPVAVVSLMTAVAVGEVAAQGSEQYYLAAIALALLCGVMLIAMGALRLGFLANFLSHPVISGFITASGIIIAASQLKHIFGIDAGGHNLVDIVTNLVLGLAHANGVTVAIGIGVMAFLFWVRHRLKALLSLLGVGERLADIIAKAGPVIGVAATALLTWSLALHESGLRIVGVVPAGLPSLMIPDFDLPLWRELLISALLISVIGFVESVSVAQTLAAKKRQRIDPDQELIGLGAANLGAAFTGGYPVTGGFSRSVVNYDAGAVTPAAGIFTAAGIALATVYLTPALHYLPKATLAATIIVAVLSLIDLRALQRTWIYSQSDFAAMVITIVFTLVFGVEAGVVAGVVVSVALHLYRTSRPHWAIVGQVPGTEHFRNVNRHRVVTCPEVLSLRVDESLYFANARFLEDLVNEQIALGPAIRHVVLMCPAVNGIDASALESIEAINARLAAGDVSLHLSEVKGPVMDLLERSGFLQHLSGHVFLSHYDAMQTLAPSTIAPAALKDSSDT